MFRPNLNYIKMKKVILIFALMFTYFGTNAQTDSIKETIKDKHELIGKASYYGSEYKSTRHTANGEHFNKNAYTAAHKTLPFGTIVKVTNTKNNKTVEVRINDRGPFIKGRIIDVTVAAAKELGMIQSGVAHVEMEIISMPEKRRKNI